MGIKECEHQVNSSPPLPSRKIALRRIFFEKGKRELEKERF